MGPAPDDERLGLRGLFRYALAATDTCNLVRRRFLQAARRLTPILRRGEYVVVLRWPDVRAVLARPADFSVRIFAMRMAETTGITFLGMDPGSATTAKPRPCARRSKCPTRDRRVTVR